MSNNLCAKIRLQEKLEQCLAVADELKADVAAIRIGEALEALEARDAIEETGLRHYGSNIR